MEYETNRITQIVFLECDFLYMINEAISLKMGMTLIGSTHRGATKSDVFSLVSPTSTKFTTSTPTMKMGPVIVKKHLDPMPL